MANLERRRESMSCHPSGSSDWEVVSTEEDGSAGPARTLDSYLKLAKESTETVEKMFSRNFNNEQCGYLVDKLKVVVQSASSFLEGSRAEGQRPCSSADIDRHVETFKHFVALAYQIESFVQGCCNDAWLQAALTLANVSEYVSSIGFNLELCRVAFCQECAATESLSLDQVGDINNAEVGLVKNLASVDLDTLFDKVILEMPSLRNESKDLAIYVLHRLRAIKPIPASRFPTSSSREINDMGSYFGKLFTRVQQPVRLGNSATGGTIDRVVWLGTPVAMKTFYGPEDPEFMKEVEILARLRHPNITSMFCSVMDKRKCSIIMELMDEDLRALINRRLDGNSDSPPFTILEAIDIMLQIAEGVNYLHGNGIEHRDLKSLNILVKLGVKESKIISICAKVADFGLSKIKENSLRYSNYTLNIGTTRWMAPEIINVAQVETQRSGKKLPKFPFKSDIYSFAMVCYEILTGELPFSSTTLNIVKKMVVEGFRPDLPAHCPFNLKALIERCWSQLPGERPSSTIICLELKYLKYLLMADRRPLAPPMPIKHPPEQVECGFFQSKKTFEFLLAVDNKDLFVIKKANTHNNSVEVHILSSESNYQSYSLHTSTPLPLEPNHTTWTFCLAANRDLYGIKRLYTGSNRTEVHILTKKSSYQVFSLQVGTALHETNDTYQFLVSGINDLYIIKKQQTGTNTTEIHTLSASSTYKSFGLHLGSGIGETGLEWDFFGLDSLNNVYAIKKTDVASELYILTSISRYKEFWTLQLPKIDHSQYAFVLGPQVNSFCDLFIIKKSYTSSRYMEVQVVSALSNYTELKAEYWSNLPEEPIRNEGFQL